MKIKSHKKCILYLLIFIYIIYYIVIFCIKANILYINCIVDMLKYCICINENVHMRDKLIITKQSNNIFIVISVYLSLVNFSFFLHSYLEILH